jgi:hypothetical protein
LAIFQSLWQLFFHGKIAKDFGNFFTKKFVIFNLIRLLKYELLSIFFSDFEGP